MAETFKKPSILIVDGDSGIRESIRSIIYTGFQDAIILEAGDGLVAQQKLERQVFNLIVMDTALHKISGQKLIDSVGALPEKFHPRSVLIFTDAAYNINWGSQLRRLYYIKKGSETELLEATITNCIKGSLLRRSLVFSKVSEAFVKATLDVFSQIGQIKLAVEAVFPKTESRVSGDVVALLAISFPTVKGGLALAFQADCLLFLTNEMTGENFTKLTAEVGDSAREFLSQIAVVARRTLENDQLLMQYDPPVIKFGMGSELTHPPMTGAQTIRFRSVRGWFDLEFTMEG